MNKLIQIGYAHFIPSNSIIKRVAYLSYPKPQGCLRIDYAVPNDKADYAIVLNTAVEIRAAIKFFKRVAASANRNLQLPRAKTVNLTPEISFWLK